MHCFLASLKFAPSPGDVAGLVDRASSRDHRLGGGRLASSPLLSTPTGLKWPAGSVDSDRMNWR
jgi:hypothetical protein